MGSILLRGIFTAIGTMIGIVIVLFIISILLIVPSIICSTLYNHLSFTNIPTIQFTDWWIGFVMLTIIRFNFMLELINKAKEKINVSSNGS